MKETKADIQLFVDGMNLKKPLSVQDAFKGGRTNAFTLKYDVKSGEKIHYIDVTSLYPTVNKKDDYPAGHPEIICAILRTSRNISES